MSYKKITSLNLDNEVVEEAKKNFLNLSAIAEKAIKEACHIKEVKTDVLNCEFCGRECDKAFVDKQGNYNDGLTWLCPDEKWICPNCLKTKSLRKIF